jgi:hypothetical protein
MTQTWRSAGLLACLLALAPRRESAAQAVRGVVIEAASRAPVPGATIELLADGDSVPLRTTSDSAGAFSFTTRRAGTYTIQAKRIGFLVAQPTALRLEPSLTMSLEMRLDSKVVPLEPVSVMARGNDWLADFERRRATGAFGRFLTRRDIGERAGQQTTSLFKTIPGFLLQARRRGGPGSSLLMRGTAGLCQPAVFIDGTYTQLTADVTLDDMLSPQMIEGVEIYNTVAAAPTQYRTGTCGVVLFWTRRGSGEAGRPFRWREIALGAGVAIGILVLILKH